MNSVKAVASRDFRTTLTTLVRQKGSDGKILYL
jgi:hypothetical protein